MKLWKWKKIAMLITLILCMCCVCFTSRTTLIFVGNSYENSKEINVTITLDDIVVYSGLLNDYELPRLLKKEKLKVGFYKVSAKLDYILVERQFFYFFQKSIWIDFDFTTNNPLLISKFYRQISL